MEDSKMYKKINVYVNKEYIFSTNRYKTCRDLKNHLRAVKHEIYEGLKPDNTIGTCYITINDYDKLICTYAK